MVSPDAFQEHRARDGAPGVAEEVFQQLEFAALEFNAFAVAVRGAREEIQGEVAEVEACFVRVVFGGRAAVEGFQSRHEFGEGEGFGEVVVGADIESADALVDGAERREDQHRRAQSAAAPLREEFEAVGVGAEHSVQDDGVPGDIKGEGFGVGGGFGPFDAMSLFAEAAQEVVAGFGVVFYEEYLHWGVNFRLFAPLTQQDFSRRDAWH